MGGASHMINDNIFNIFCFSTFSFGYFTNPVFWQNLEKIAQKTRSRKYPKEKNKKQKMLKMLLIIICEAPPKNFNNFKAIFGHFYSISLEKLAIYPKTRIRQFGQNQILIATGK